MQIESHQSLVEYIVKALVENPDAVEILVVDGSTGPLIELRVAPSDRGRVIGKKGRTAHAIRTLLASMGPDEEKVGLEIVD